MPESSIMTALMGVIQDRKARAPSEPSYVVELMRGGVAKIGAKIVEEAGFEVDSEYVVLMKRLALTQPALKPARTQAAAQVIDQDDVVDALAHQVYRELLSYMAEDPKTISRATKILLISKYLERIADHATNIAEMVVFMVDGKMIRHATSLPEEDSDLE